MDILGTLGGLVQDSGFAGFFAAGGWKNLIMIAVACVLLYLGIHKKFEPLLLVWRPAHQHSRGRAVPYGDVGRLHL